MSVKGVLKWFLATALALIASVLTTIYGPEFEIISIIFTSILTALICLPIILFCSFIWGLGSGHPVANSDGVKVIYLRWPTRVFYLLAGVLFLRIFTVPFAFGIWERGLLHFSESSMLEGIFGLLIYLMFSVLGLWGVSMCFFRRLQWTEEWLESRALFRGNRHHLWCDLKKIDRGEETDTLVFHNSGSVLLDEEFTDLAALMKLAEKHVPNA